VGFGGVGSALGMARCSRDGGSKGKGESRAKGEGRKTGVCEGAGNEKAAAATVVSWGRWWQTRWEWWRRQQRRGVVGKAKANFKGLSVDSGRWRRGRKAEEDKCEKEGEEKGGDGG
jgi:hypothetical protein